MRLTTIAAPVPASLHATFTWEAGNHLFDDEYQFVVGAPTTAAMPFADAVAAAHQLVRAAERDVPGFGVLSPAHAVLAVAGGYAPVVLRTDRLGKEMPIDGAIANGRGGAVLRGLTFERSVPAGVIAAIVGTTDLIDLRRVPGHSTWWRTADPGREPGHWGRRS